MKKNNHVLAIPGAHLHLDHALPYTTLLWVAMASVINFVLVSINSPYHGGSSVVRSSGLTSLRWRPRPATYAHFASLNC